MQASGNFIISVNSLKSKQPTDTSFNGTLLECFQCGKIQAFVNKHKEENASSTDAWQNLFCPMESKLEVPFFLKQILGLPLVSVMVPQSSRAVVATASVTLLQGSTSLPGEMHNSSMFQLLPNKTSFAACFKKKTSQQNWIMWSQALLPPYYISKLGL